VAIISILGTAWALFAAIWAFLLKACMDARNLNYIVIAAASSSIVLGVWRLYTRYLDNGIANLYPTFVYCEQIMGVPSEYGTVAYLRESVLRGFDLPSDKQALLDGVRELVENRHIGNRGHDALDRLAALVILVQFLICICVVYVGGGFAQPLWPAATATVLSLALIAIGACRFQRNPTEAHLKRAFSPKSPTTGA
jgi:hypothetical protein